MRTVWVVQERARVHSLPVRGCPVYLQRTVVRWRQCSSIVQNTRLLLLSVLQPAADKVITYRELKWKSVTKNVTPHSALFVQCFWSLMFFCGSPIPVNSAVDPSLIPAHLSSNQQSADAYVIRFQRCAAGIFGGGWEALSVQKEMCAQTDTFVKL